MRSFFNPERIKLYDLYKVIYEGIIRSFANRRRSTFSSRTFYAHSLNESLQAILLRLVSSRHPLSLSLSLSSRFLSTWSQRVINGLVPSTLVLRPSRRSYQLRRAPTLAVLSAIPAVATHAETPFHSENSLPSHSNRLWYRLEFLASYCSSFLPSFSIRESRRYLQRLIFRHLES